MGRKYSWLKVGKFRYFSCIISVCRPFHAREHGGSGSRVGYRTSRRSLCIMIVCQLSPPIGADRGKCGVLGIIGNGGGGLKATSGGLEEPRQHSLVDLGLDLGPPQIF